MRGAAARLVAALVLASGSALAADDAETCQMDSGEIAIAACDRVIASPRRAPAVRATALVNRGQEWYLKMDYDRAHADFSAAIRINRGPDIAVAYGNRGNVNKVRGNCRAAIQDYGKAITLVRDYPAAYVGRGLCHEELGEPGRAIGDYKMALTLPRRFDDGQWAHETAQRRLDQLGGQ